MSTLRPTLSSPPQAAQITPPWSANRPITSVWRYLAVVVLGISWGCGARPAESYAPGQGKSEGQSWSAQNLPLIKSGYPTLLGLQGKDNRLELAILVHPMLALTYASACYEPGQAIDPLDHPDRYDLQRNGYCSLVGVRRISNSAMRVDTSAVVQVNYPPGTSTEPTFFAVGTDIFRRYPQWTRTVIPGANLAALHLKQPIDGVRFRLAGARPSANAALAMIWPKGTALNGDEAPFWKSMRTLAYDEIKGPTVYHDGRTLLTWNYGDVSVATQQALQRHVITTYPAVDQAVDVTGLNYAPFGAPIYWQKPGTFDNYLVALLVDTLRDWGDDGRLQPVANVGVVLADHRQWLEQQAAIAKRRYADYTPPTPPGAVASQTRILDLAGRPCSVAGTVFNRCAECGWQYCRNNIWASCSAASTTRIAAWCEAGWGDGNYSCDNELRCLGGRRNQYPGPWRCGPGRVGGWTTRAEWQSCDCGHLNGSEACSGGDFCLRAQTDGSCHLSFCTSGTWSADHGASYVSAQNATSAGACQP